MTVNTATQGDLREMKRKAPVLETLLLLLVFGVLAGAIIFTPRTLSPEEQELVGQWTSRDSVIVYSFHSDGSFTMIEDGREIARGTFNYFGLTGKDRLFDLQRYEFDVIYNPDTHLLQMYHIEDGMHLKGDWSKNE